MKRREFIAILGGFLTAWPAAALSQSDRLRRIGILMGIESGPDARKRVASFKAGLEELGWDEERNCRIEIVWGPGDADSVRKDAAALLRKSPDVVLANGPVPTVQLQKMTRNIPIVFVQVPDPEELSLVKSLPNPGGNITGFTHFQSSFGGKWLESLKEIAPNVRHVSAMSLLDHPAMPGFLRDILSAARPLGLEVAPAGVRDARDIERAIEDLAKKANPGLILLPSPIAPIHSDLIVSLTARHRIPAIYPFGYFAANGGLMSYGVDTADLFHKAATYIDRILRGTSPAELPVQAPTKYQLLINAKTAKALGLTVPPTLLARADEVIE